MAERDVRTMTRLQRFGITALVLIALAMVGGSVFIWSGYYNVSASRDHWGVTTWLLTQVRDHSIRARASGIEAPDLSDPDLIALGAEHFRTGCTSCHGSADGEQNPIYANMLPRPPAQRGAADVYQPEALFWIINSGLKYTGMPAWPADERSDEVWAVVAFLEALNQTGAAAMPDVSTAESGMVRQDNCVRCHGDGDTAPTGSLVPSLNGQSPTYLARALMEYREGERQSGIMAPVAHGLSDDTIAQLADYYGSLPGHKLSAQPPSALVEQGRQLALHGDADADIPACQSCHAGANPQFPRLAGQSPAYMEGQLALWRTGLHDQTAFGSIMAAVGQRLTQDQARAVSAFYGALEVAEDTP